MKKEEAIKQFKQLKINPIGNVIEDKKLQYFIQKAVKKFIKSHYRNGVAPPETIFLYQNEGGTWEQDIVKLNGTDKQMYFDLINILEVNTKPKYLISLSEGWSLSGEELESEVAKYGSIEKHPESYDILAVKVKANGQFYAGKSIVEGKKVSPMNWFKETPSGPCNFTSFSNQQ